jgi:aminotransferase
MTTHMRLRRGLDLSQGFPDFVIPAELNTAAIEAITNDFNQYPVTFGEPGLRRAIAAKAKRYNGLDYDPESEITVTCGATEAMIATLKAIINPGDEVIIFEPFYENYGPDCVLSGATPRYVASTSDWSFSLGAFRRVHGGPRPNPRARRITRLERSSQRKSSQG